MRLHKLSRAASVLALAVAAGACDEGLTEVNQNPNNPTDAASEYFLRSGIQSAVGGNTAASTHGVLGASNTLDHAGLWVQHVAKIQYAEEDRYQPRNDFFQNHWDSYYVGPLKDFDVIIAKSQEAPARPMEGAVAQVMRAWTYGAMSDMWGDIPYAEALKGEEGNFSPSYDPQQAIYNDLLARLTAANAALPTSGSVGFGTGAADLIYGGNALRWKKFANSLRLRLAMHLVKADPAKARTEFEAAMATGQIFTSNADNAALQYTGASPNQNPVYYNEAVSGRDDHRVSATMVNKLKSLNDPRLGIYADPIQSNGTSYVGYGNGLANNSMKLEETSKIGKIFRAANAPAYLMTYAEVLFLRAEAARLGWNAGGTAADLYHQAIRAAMQQYNVPAAQIDAYLAQPSVAYATAGANKQQVIAEQKWIALFMQGVEAWSNWRLTGYPQLTPGPQARPGGVPRRYIYPGLEQSVNKTNLDAAIARQGNVALQGGRVWWDKP